MTATARREGATFVIWRLSDGRAGHDNQSLGLVEAIGRRVACHVCVFTITRDNALQSIPALLREARDAPDPTLLVGAGHATHLPLLAARWRRGGRIVVLMRPTLPRRWFDLCIVPAHDGVAADTRTLVTHGALNRVRPCEGGKQPRSALLLVGGPSREYGWSETDLLAQIRVLLDAHPDWHWQLCDSRRTPSSTRGALAALARENVTAVSVETVDPDWLPRTLAATETVWVSEDSASMVYEALSAQAAVGVLKVPVLRRGRVAGGVERLCEQGWVTTWEDWRAGHVPHPVSPPLAEAERCAQWIEERWLRAGA